jgi:hypothetical protein
MVEQLAEARAERWHSMVDGALVLAIAQCLLACAYWGLR